MGSAWRLYEVPVTWSGRSRVTVKARSGDEARERAQAALDGEGPDNPTAEMPDLDVEVGWPVEVDSPKPHAPPPWVEAS